MIRIKNLFIISGLIIVFTLFISPTAAANPAKDIKTQPGFLAKDVNAGEDMRARLVQDATKQLEKLIPEEILKFIGGNDYLKGLVSESLKGIKVEDNNIAVNDVLPAVKQKLDSEIKNKIVETILGEVNKLVPAEILELAGGPEVIKTVIDEELKDVTLDNIQNIQLDQMLTSVRQKLEPEIKNKMVETILGEVNKLVPAEILELAGGPDVIKTAIDEELKDVTLDNIENTEMGQMLTSVMQKLEPEIKNKLLETILGEVNKLVPAEILGFVGGPEVIKTVVDEELEDVTADNIQDIQMDQMLISVVQKLEPEIKERLADFLTAKIQEIVPDKILALISDDVDGIIRKQIQSINIDNLQNFRVDQSLLAIKDDVQPLIKRELEGIITEKMNDIIPEEIMAFMPDDVQDSILGQVRDLTLGSTQELVSDQFDKAMSQAVQNLIPEPVTLDTMARLQAGIEKKNKDVETDKIWDLMFSDDIDEASLEGNILVSRDSFGIFKAPIIVNSMGRRVTVKPELEWSAGNSYYLLIKSGLKSIGGESMAEQVKIVFTVKEKPSLDDLLARATTLLSQNRLLEAIQLANEAAAMAPDDYRAFLISGKAKMAFDPQSAEIDLSRAFSLNPDYGEIAVLKANNSDFTGGAEENKKAKPLKLSTYK